MAAMPTQISNDQQHNGKAIQAIADAVNPTDAPTYRQVTAVSGAIVSVSTSRSLAATDYDQTLNVTTSVTLTGVALTPGRRIYGVIVGAFTVTFAGTAVNANGATQCAGDGAMFSIVIDGNGRPCWSSNRLA